MVKNAKSDEARLLDLASNLDGLRTTPLRQTQLPSPSFEFTRWWSAGSRSRKRA